MHFVVLELKTDFEDAFNRSSTTFDKQDEAEQHFHQVLATAATADKYALYACTMVNEHGALVRTEFYTHEPPEPEPEPAEPETEQPTDATETGVQQ